MREDSAQRNRGLGADDGYDGAEMPFLDHLEDLRKMLFRIIITLLIAMIICFSVNHRLLDWVRLPMKWANIGGGGPAFFKASDNVEDPNAVKVGDWVVTRGGFVGRIKMQDLEAGITLLEIGDPPKSEHPLSELEELEPPAVVETSQEADGTSQEADGTSQEADGTAQEADGTAQEADGTPQEADGTSQEADGTAQEVDGTAQEADGTSQEVDGTAQEADGTAQEADGTAQEADGTAQEADGTAQEVDGTAQEADDSPKGIQVGSKVMILASEEVGMVTAIDAASQVATVAIGEGQAFWLRSTAIVNKLQAREDLPEAEKQTDDPRAMIANQNFLIMEVFQPYEALVLTLKLAFFAGLVLSFPLVIFFIAQFILPGLRQVEKRVVFPSLGVGFLLFLVGASFAFCVGLPLALDFLADYTLERGIEPGWRIGYYIKFVTQVTLVFGLAFELPVAVMALVKLDLLTYRTMRDSRAYAIVVLMVLSAFLTPPDPMTLVLLSVPLILLYEICIWMAYFIERKALRLEAEEERRRAEERAQREKERQERLAAADSMTEEEKRELVAEDIEKYESTVTDDDTHALDSHEDPHHDPHHDEHADYHHDDPHHDWDHDYHHDDHHDPHAGMPTMIDINNASIEELQKLPGVGPKLAERLYEARPYYSEDELEYHAHLPQSVIKLIIDRIYYG